jgi:NAD+ diphosphatase
MGRKSVWPEGRYSTLAGFSEMGESLEECVLREVLEESGVRVARESVFFSSSQPWPFPRSLMIGSQASVQKSAHNRSLLPCRRSLLTLDWIPGNSGASFGRRVALYEGAGG